MGFFAAFASKKPCVEPLADCGLIRKEKVVAHLNALLAAEQLGKPDLNATEAHRQAGELPEQRQ